MFRKEIISLCEVVPYIDKKTAQKQTRLQRYYDVEIENNLNLLVTCMCDSPSYIYFKPNLDNKLTAEGSWGLWKWRQEGKQILSDPYTILSPIQVVEYSLEPAEIVEQLKDGIEDGMVEGNIRFLFANVSKGVGILCGSNDFETYENKFRLKQETYSLPQIQFKSNSLLRVKSNTQKKLAFLNEVTPNQYFYIQAYPEKAISSVIVKRLSQKCKVKDVRMLQNALADVTTESISQEVARLCRCDEHEAIQLIDRFLESCRQPQLLFDGDVKILSRIIECNEELKQKYIAKIEERWRSENLAPLQDQIAQKNGEVSQLNQEITGLQETKKGLEQALETVRKEKKAQDSLVCQVKEDLQNIQSKLDESRKELPKLYSDSFNQARQDVGRYLAELAIYSPNFVANPNDSTPTSSKSIVYESSQTNKFVSNDESFYEDSERYNDEIDAVDILEDGLKGIGFEENSANLTSSFLCSIYFNRRSLILTGSFAQQIAEATSCALTGRLPDALVCEGACEQRMLDEAFADPDSILLVKNPLDGAWFERLASELAVRRKTVFLSVPFVENLRLIPPSFFDVALPYVTSLSVLDQSFEGRKVAYKYGVRSSDFTSEIQDPKPIDLGDKPSRIGIGRNVANNIRRLLAYSIEALSHDEETVKKSVFQFGLFSYAYATDSLPTFFELLNENNVVYKRNNPYEDFVKFAK